MDGETVKPRKKPKYYQVTDGEWIRPTMRKHREMCCGCHLVHVIDYRVVDGAIEYKATVDNRATASARRAFKFTPETEE